MSEDNVIAKKYILLIVVVAIINLTVGGLLLLLGYNIVFNVMFDGNVLLYTIFNALSYIGDDLILIILVASVIIVYDMKFGKNLGVALLGSVYLYSVLKDIWQDPRPYTNYGQETSYGFPSGHAQDAFTAWGLIGYEAHRKRQNIIVLICLAFIYLIGISRIVIGVHDIEDIWGGFFYGAIFLILFICLEPIISKKINTLSFIPKFLLAIIIPLVMFIIPLIVFPLGRSDYGLACGALMGLMTGYLIEEEKIKYNPKTLEMKYKIINLIIGLVLTIVLYLVLSILIKSDLAIFRFLKYFLLAFVVIVIGPLIFTKIKR